MSIYNTWVTRSDLPGAAQIALLLLLAIVVVLVASERWARGKQRYSSSAQRSRAFEPRRVSPAKGLLLFATGLLPDSVGFAAPAAYLVVEAWKRVEFAGLSPRFLIEAVNTIGLASFATSHDDPFRPACRLCRPSASRCGIGVVSPALDARLCRSRYGRRDRNPHRPRDI